MPVILHCRRRRYSLRAAAHHEVHSLLRNRPSKRKVADRDVGKELLKGARIDDSARQRMLAEPRRFFEDSDLKITERSEEHTSELQSRLHLVCRLLLEKK